MRAILGALLVMTVYANGTERQPRILKIAQIGAPCLYQECEPVTDFEDPALHTFMEDMRATFAHDIHNTAGLAAPQLHVNKRIILFWDGYNVDNYMQSKHGMELVLEMFNPSYKPVGDRMDYRIEACKSLKGFGVDVPRYHQIIVQWQDITGKWIEREFIGREARCLQHEIDHLNGILCLMQADDLSRVGTVSTNRCALAPLGKERECKHTSPNDAKAMMVEDHSGPKTGFETKILAIAEVGEPNLYQKCEEVEDPTSDEIKEIISDMRQTILEFGYPFSGLAAPQVFINKKIAFFYGGFHDERPNPMKFEPLTAMINLHVEPVGDEKEYLFERCLSSLSLVADVPRYKKVKYRYQDEVGEWVEGVATGFTARVLQHEYDHLMGKVCLMRVDGRDRIASCDMNRHTKMKPKDDKHW